MKRIFIAGSLLGLLVTSSAYAFPVTIVYGICEVDSGELQDEVGDLAKRYSWSLRFMGPGSQYRKHVTRHVKEVVAVLDDAQNNEACSDARKEELIKLKDDLEGTSGRRSVSG